MTTIQREEIAEVKQRIKELTAMQIEQKRLMRKPHETVPDICLIQGEVVYRARAITALLVRYHGVRGTGKEASHAYKVRPHQAA